MSDPMRTFYFRRALTVDPYILPITNANSPTPVQISKAALIVAGVTSFKLHNPNPFWVWVRGWSGQSSDMPVVKEKGHYLPPGAVDINTSQLPDWIAAQPQAEPNYPVPVDGTGNLITPGRIIMIYGSGNA